MLLKIFTLSKSRDNLFFYPIILMHFIKKKKKKTHRTFFQFDLTIFLKVNQESFHVGGRECESSLLTQKGLLSHEVVNASIQLHTLGV